MSDIDSSTPETSANRPESVWDYPRPPRIETTARHLIIRHAGVLLADTVASLRILETSHPPVYYVPQKDIAMHLLKRSSRRSSFCEFKGMADYWSIDLSAVIKGSDQAAGHVSARSTDAAWSYSQPSPSYGALKDYLAFYASRVDDCFVDGERVIAQPGDFYGGWISSHVTGPFKGAHGTMGW